MTLQKLVETAIALRQEHILVTADVSIYSKAVQILWTAPDPLAGRVTMRLGGMHLTMSFIDSIGKLSSDGGLCSMLTGSEVYADVSLTLMLQGKQYAEVYEEYDLYTKHFFTCSCLLLNPTQ